MTCQYHSCPQNIKILHQQNIKIFHKFTKYKNPSFTKYKNPSSTKYKNPSSTKYKNPSFTKYKNPSSTKYKNPSSTKYKIFHLQLLTNTVLPLLFIMNSFVKSLLNVIPTGLSTPSCSLNTISRNVPSGDNLCMSCESRPLMYT